MLAPDARIASRHRLGSVQVDMADGVAAVVYHMGRGLVASGRTVLWFARPKEACHWIIWHEHRPP